MRAEDNMAHRENKEDKEKNKDIDKKEKDKTKLFTCSLIQAAARAATMQGHAGFQRPRRRRLPPTRSPPSPPLTSSTTNCSSQESVLMNGSSLIKILFTSWSPLWNQLLLPSPHSHLAYKVSLLVSLFLSQQRKCVLLLLLTGNQQGCLQLASAHVSLAAVSCSLHPPVLRSTSQLPRALPASSHMLHSTASATNVLLNNWH